MIQQPPDEPHPVCRISEFELALVFAPAYCDDRQLARPQLSPGAVPFSLPREVVVWGHLVYEMLTCAELTQPALLQWSERAARGEPQPGPPLLWQLLALIFLPLSTVSVGPTLEELSRTADAEGATLPLDARREVERCSPQMPPAAAEGTSTAALLGEARRHYGTRLVCTPMFSPTGEFAIQFSYEDSPEAGDEATKAPAEETPAEKAAVFKAALESAAVEQAAAEVAHAAVAAADPTAAAEVVAKESASRRASAAGWLHSMPTTQEGWVKKMESRTVEKAQEAKAVEKAVRRASETAVEMAARSAPPGSEDQGAGYYDGTYYSESGPAPERKASAASLNPSGRRRHRRSSKKNAEAKVVEKAAEEARLETEKKAAAQKKREARSEKAAAAGAAAKAASAAAAQSQVETPPGGGVSIPAAPPKRSPKNKAAAAPTAQQSVDARLAGMPLPASVPDAAAVLGSPHWSYYSDEEAPAAAPAAASAAAPAARPVASSSPSKVSFKARDPVPPYLAAEYSEGEDGKDAAPAPGSPHWSYYSDSEAPAAAAPAAAAPMVLPAHLQHLISAISSPVKKVDSSAFSFKNRASERWAAAGEFAIDMVAVHARLAEEVIMPTAEEMEANLGLGFRSIQTCVYAKRVAEDAKEILAWKAMMIQRAVAAAKGPDDDEKPAKPGSKLAKFKEVDLELKGRIRVNKGLEDMLQRNEADRQRVLLADFEEETRARADGHVIHHSKDDELNARCIHLDVDRNDMVPDWLRNEVVFDQGAVTKAVAAAAARPRNNAARLEKSALKPREVEVTLTKQTASSAVGLTLASRPADGGAGETPGGRVGTAAVFVARITDDSLAAAAGFELRDEVTYINGTKVHDHDAATALVRAATDDVVFVLRRVPSSMPPDILRRLRQQRVLDALNSKYRA